MGGLASSAHAFTNTAIKCYLVGLVSVGQQLAQKSVQWFESAVETNERPMRYFANGTEAARLYDLAMRRWLYNAAHDEASLFASVDYRERYLAGAAGRDRVEVALVLPEYLDAGRYELVRRHVVRLWKDSKRPQEVEVADCLAQATQDSPELCHLQIQTLLQNRVHDWLRRGHFETVAKWLKVTSWNPDRSRTPEGVLLEALKYV